MNKILTILVLALFILPSGALADGAIFRPGGYVDEKQQVAYINYQGGFEKMIVSVTMDELRGSDAVWILPVPANPNEVVIDVLDVMPYVYGYDVMQEANSRVDDVIRKTKYTLILPLLFFQPVYYAGGIAREAMTSGLKDISISTGEVTVYEHLEKEGMTAELVGAKNGMELYLYLKNKGLDIDFKRIPVFNSYLGKDYVFVVSWITASEKKYIPLEGDSGTDYIGIPPSLQQARGISVTFPTDKIFYPLLPTSVYGSKVVPAKIYVLDYVNPELYDTIRPYVTTKYYRGYSSNSYDQKLRAFYGNMDTSNFKYTMIDFSIPSKYFTDDLWFNNNYPTKVNYATKVGDLFRNHGRSMTWLLIAVISLVSGALAGLIIFKKDWKRFALVGLANILSIIGLVIAVIFTKTKVVDKKLMKQIKQAGLLTVGRDWQRKVLYVVLFIVFFVLIGTILKYFIKAPL